MNQKPQYPEPPPPYSTAPQPGFPDGRYPPGTSYPPQPPTMVMGGQPPVTSVTFVNIAQWGPYPMQVGCPHCNAQIMTETTASPGLLTWLLSGALVFLGCWLGCCLIPCCIPECQDIEHRCPNCKNHLGTFRRM